MSSVGESADEFRRSVQAREHQESLTPTGFRHLTNVSVSAEKVTVNESWIPGRQAREEKTFLEYISGLGMYNSQRLIADMGSSLAVHGICGMQSTYHFK
jgi:hypothetical protein